MVTEGGGGDGKMSFGREGTTDRQEEARGWKERHLGKEKKKEEGANCPWLVS